MLLSGEQKKSLQGIIKKPYVEPSCIGCSTCTAISGDVFYLDENGMSCVQKLNDYSGHDIDDSIAACPVGAIHWGKADANTGEYIGNFS